MTFFVNYHDEITSSIEILQSYIETKKVSRYSLYRIAFCLKSKLSSLFTVVPTKVYGIPYMHGTN